MHILKHENKINGAGYYGVAIGRTRSEMVHRLVCMAFHGMPTKEKPTVNHKNCNKLDNRPENLEWMSQMENATHMRKMGRHDAHAKNMSKKTRGAGNPKAKLNEKQVLEIRSLKERGISAFNLSVKYNVSVSTINGIIRRSFWTHI